MVPGLLIFMSCVVTSYMLSRLVCVTAGVGQKSCASSVLIIIQSFCAAHSRVTCLKGGQLSYHEDTRASPWRSSYDKDLSPAVTHCVTVTLRMWLMQPG